MSVNVNVLVDGRPIQKINHSGNTYLPIVNGKEFTIKIDNQNNYRVSAVVSVDGLNVIDASEASYDGNGYIVNAHSSLTIKGWRHSQEEVSQFVFVDRNGGGGYADKLKRGKDTGVIGVAIFREKPVFIPAFTIAPLVPLEPKPWTRPEPIYPYNEPWDSPWKKEGGPYPTVTLNSCGSNEVPISSNSMSMAPTPTSSKVTKSYRGRGASVSPQESAVGRGDKVDSKVRTVEFSKESRPETIVALYYDTIDGLRNKGVPVDQYVGKPNPFPAQPVNYYCPEV